jgi:hypothetical protein
MNFLAGGVAAAVPSRNIFPRAREDTRRYTLPSLNSTCGAGRWAFGVFFFPFPYRHWHRAAL